MGTPLDLIVGLGNPGPEYAATRHNVGFWFVDLLAKEHGGAFSRERKLQGEAAEIAIGSQRIRLLKPTTYMNLSGSVLKPYVRRPFWAPANDLLVDVDEAALPLGRYRFRAKGSSGGHNGLKSIEAAVSSQEYPRLRIGIAPDELRRRNFYADGRAREAYRWMREHQPVFRDRNGLAAAASYQAVLDAERVLVSDGRATAVRTANGDVFSARRAVICNVTPTFTY